MNTVLSLKITDSSYYVTIFGVKDTAISDINQVLKSLDLLAEGTSYQLFDAELIAGLNHLYHGAANAVYAIENGSNISNNLSVETLLYVACENQINKAIRLLGVSDDTNHIAVVVISEKEDDPKATLLAESLGVLDDTVIELSQEKYDALKILFSVSEDAIKSTGKEPYGALTSLITEKGALLSLRR